MTIGLLLFSAALVLGNGFFVAAEFALVKVRTTQLDADVEAGARTAIVARHLVDQLDAYLSATQLGITLTSLGLGWIGEPAVAALFEPLFHRLSLGPEMAHAVSIAIGFTTISFLHIVVGEVAPKSLAIARPVEVSRFVAVPMQAFYFLFRPALLLLNASSNALLKAVGIEPAGAHSIALEVDELRRMAEQSVAGGQLSQGQGDLLANVFSFTDRRAFEIMVPRSAVHGIDLSEPTGKALAAAVEHGHSRYPLYDGDLDEIVGVLYLKDLLPRLVSASAAPSLRDLARPALFVPQSLPAEKLMRLMQSRRIHIAVVLDEYGSVAGIVSLEDAIEELVGDIQDEYDDEPDEVEAIDQGFATDGRMLLADLADVLEIEAPESDAATLQGLLMERLERLPRVGDEVTLGEWTIRVARMERRVVSRAEITRRGAIAEA